VSIGKTTGLVSILIATVLAVFPALSGAAATRELLRSFGSFEGGNRGVAGLAVNLETGNVYVADKITHTIYVLGPDGGPPNGGVNSRITEMGGFQIEGNLPTGLAVDNSCYEHQPKLSGLACEEYDPAYGDLYATGLHGPGGVGESGILKFHLNSKKEYELVENFGPGGGGHPGVAVDSRGNVYLAIEGHPGPVIEFKKIVEKIVNGGKEEITERLEEITIPQATTPHVGYIAVDNVGDIYLGASWEFGDTGELGPAKLKVDASGNVLSEGLLTGRKVGGARPVAVNSVTNAVYVGNQSEVAEFNPDGTPRLVFGSTEPLGGSLGEELTGVIAIAVNGETERIYVSNPLHDDIDVFGPVLGPAVIEGVQPPVFGVTRTSALVAGTVNPEAGHADLYFQYVADGDYEPSASDPYSNGGQTGVRSLAGGHAPETVEHVAFTGLRPGTTYHYRMVVTNATGTTYGPDETFTTMPATPPLVVTGLPSEVTPTSVTLSGTVAPRGLPTSYVFEVGADTGYAGAKLFGNAGSSTGEVPVTVSLAYLVPGVTYHYRLVATSFDGTSYGQDGAFTTTSVPSSITQPASTPLIGAVPVLGFPSIAGAITQPRVRPEKRASSQKKLARALKACRGLRPRKRRQRCEAQAHERYRGAAKSRAADTTNHRRRK
jgi:hypothetical protein